MICDEVAKKLVTPCFAIDKQALDENCEGFADALAAQWGKSALSYSVKTNSLPWLLRYLHAKGVLAEVVSADEYDLARACGFEPSDIVFNGPVKGREQFDECVLGGGLVNLDSSREIDWVRQLANSSDRILKVGLRVNFDIDSLLPDDIGCAPYGTRFGFSVEKGALERAIAELEACDNVRIAGLHMHSTSKTRAVAVYEKLAEMARTIIEKHGLALDYLDIGGGFFGGVPGKPSFEEYVGAIAKAFAGTSIRENTALIVEPGSAIIASPVSFVSSVVDVKDVARARVVVLDGGRPNVDPLHIKTGYSLRLLSSSSTSVDRQVIAGYTCMETDRLTVLEGEVELAPGDRVVFDKVGSYTMSLNPLFISWFPDTYLVDGASVELVRGRWKASDIVDVDAKAVARGR